MRDFNFFSPYIDIKRAKKVHERYAALAGALIICILAGLLTWSLYTIKSLERDISRKEQYLKSPEVKKSLEEYEKLKVQIEKLDRYYSSASIVDAAISKKDIIRTSLLDSIALAMPKEAFLRSVSGADSNIELVCTSSNKNAIAELERNLKQISRVESVHVQGIVKTESYFTSSIIIRIKEVALSEAD